MIIDGRLHTREHSVTIQPDGDTHTFHGWLPTAPHAGDIVIFPLATPENEKPRLGQFKLVTVRKYKGSYMGKAVFVARHNPA